MYKLIYSGCTLLEPNNQLIIETFYDIYQP